MSHMNIMGMYTECPMLPVQNCVIRKKSEEKRWGGIDFNRVHPLASEHFPERKIVKDFLFRLFFLLELFFAVLHLIITSRENRSD